MTEHHRWETTLEQRRRTDPGIDDPDRRAAARDIRNARDIGYHLAQMRKQRGMTQAEVARAMGVSQARVSRMEHGDIEKMRLIAPQSMGLRERRGAGRLAGWVWVRRRGWGSHCRGRR
jgi:predicted XRE-type DNA-binding protein